MYTKVFTPESDDWGDNDSSYETLVDIELEYDPTHLREFIHELYDRVDNLLDGVVMTRTKGEAVKVVAVTFDDDFAFDNPDVVNAFYIYLRVRAATIAERRSWQFLVYNNWTGKVTPLAKQFE